MDFFERLRLEQTKLIQKREDLVRQIAKIDAELAEFQTALRLAQRFGEVQESPQEHKPHTPKSSGWPTNQHYASRKGATTVSKLALQIISDAFPKGLRANQIKDIAQDRSGQEIKSTSLTVALGRHKKAGRLRCEGRTWFLIPQQSRQQIEGMEDTLKHFRNESGASAATDAPEADGEAPSSSGRTPDLQSNRLYCTDTDE